ncbi:MAG: hypothetical protein AB7P40_19595 [Chloroflexota bacterium]
MTPPAPTPAAVIRAGGLATIVGGALFALFPLLHPDHTEAGYTSATWVPIHLMPNLGAILVLFGLVGLLIRQFQRAGWIGLAGFVVAFIGTASFVMGAMIEMFIIPFLGLQNPAFEEGPPPAGIGEAFMVINLLFAAGYILLGIATVRARVMPASVGALLILGALALLFMERVAALVGAGDALWVLGPVILGAGLAWLGYALWSGPVTGEADRSRRRQAAASGAAL